MCIRDSAGSRRAQEPTRVCAVHAYASPEYDEEHHVTHVAPVVMDPCSAADRTFGAAGAGAGGARRIGQARVRRRAGDDSLRQGFAGRQPDQGQGADRDQAGAEFRFHAHDRAGGWAKLARRSPEQQKQLTDQFRTLLVRTYSGALTGYRNNTMDYKPLRTNPGDTDVIVRTEVRRAGQAPVQIDYNMGKTPEGW